MSPLNSPEAPKNRRLRTLLIAGGVTVALSGAGAAAVFAATNTATPSPSPSATPGQQNGMRGPMKGLRGMMNALHGEFVVQRNGSYVTVLLQKGTVDAVSSTSITVKSADGFSQTYAINDKTVIRKVDTTSSQRPAKVSASDLKSGDEVRIVGDKSGSGVTATNIVDGKLGGFGQNAQGRHGMGGMRGMHRQDGDSDDQQQQQSPSPSPSALPGVFSS
ncbi:hypothetical protein KIH31_08130 [Paenarthrobacter sp. DKR-5]|uniref:DUF5666 domain-containing protein n=1 Tax=Paenarthrobacter sp. DKR-5 TaxID=2835535 RepID=UPI001BDCAF4B|nr:DUF5666 domain-containing protein [Paenarthrobacter sp. DKR-5]MBT1002571.1 hypothetical protein [Paenarthrobacter sp. DKR-5]